MRTFNLSAASPRGSALVLVLIVCTILAGVTLLVIERTRTEDMATEVLRYGAAYDSMSEAATEYAIRQIANNIASNTPLQSPTRDGSGKEVWDPMPSVSVCGVPVCYTFRRLNNDGTPTYLDSNGKAGPAPYDGNGYPLVRYYDSSDLIASPANNAPPARYESRNPMTDQWIPYDRNSPGYVRYIYPYKITAYVNYNSLIGGPNGVVDTALRASLVNKIMEFHAQPLWQFFAFWGGNTDLEITTGPKACFAGRIHANKSIYLGNDSYSAGNDQVYVTNYLRTAGKLNHGRFDNYGSVTNPTTPRADNGATGGTVWIKRYGQDGNMAAGKGPLDDYFTTCPGVTGTDGRPAYSMLESKWYWNQAGHTVPSFTGFDSQFTGYDANNNLVYTDPVDTPPFLQRAPGLFDNTVATGAQGVMPMSVPKISSMQSYVAPQGQGYRFDATTHQLTKSGAPVASPTKGTYYAQAQSSGLVIQTTASNSTTITLNGATIPSSTYATGGKYDGLITYPQMKDNREGQTVTLTQVSLKIMNQVLEDYNVPTTTGILAYGMREDTLDSYLSGTPTTDPVTGVVTYAAPSVRNGFRLADGELLRNPFTFASEDPVYVMGDFNTGQNRKFTDTNNDQKDDATSKYMLYDLINQAPANDWTSYAKTADTAAASPATMYMKSDGTTLLIDTWKDTFDNVFHDNGSGNNDKPGAPAAFVGKTKDQVIDLLNARTRKQGASIMADAVNVLSNAWTTATQDAATTLTNRVASNTIYNFAMLSGQVPTILNSYYSGGMENYPRFHEDWGGKTCNYRGSFVNLYNSVMAKQRWGKSEVYNPPNRLWAFDKDFETFSKLPPFFPMAVGAARVVWWK